MLELLIEEYLANLADYSKNFEKDIRDNSCVFKGKHFCISESFYGSKSPPQNSDCCIRMRNRVWLYVIKWFWICVNPNILRQLLNSALICSSNVICQRIWCSDLLQNLSLQPDHLILYNYKYWWTVRREDIDWHLSSFV